MSVLGQPGQPHLLVFKPEDGLRRAMSLPAEDDFGVGDVSDEEWQVFYEAWLSVEQPTRRTRTDDGRPTRI